jgi:hypothetical protein
MTEPTTAYEVVLRRDEIADYIRRNLPAFRRIFLSLDEVAAILRDQDDHLTEVLHSLADILRGVLAEVHGVDFRPTSELGPDDTIDLNHAVRVLAGLVDEIPQLRNNRVVESRSEPLPGPGDRPGGGERS